MECSSLHGRSRNGAFWSRDFRANLVSFLSFTYLIYNDGIGVSNCNRLSHSERGQLGDTQPSTSKIPLGRHFGSPYTDSEHCRVCSVGVTPSLCPPLFSLDPKKLEWLIIDHFGKINREAEVNSTYLLMGMSSLRSWTFSTWPGTLSSHVFGWNSVFWFSTAKWNGQGKHANTDLPSKSA